MMPTFLPESEWRRRRAEHRESLRAWAEGRVQRAERGQKHPVWDFLFEYYSYRPAHLMRWSPGVGVELLGAKPGELDWPQFVPTSHGFTLPADSFPSHRHDYLNWAIGYLEATLAREPHFACFGLHEWAMVYRTRDLRHRVPLRLSPELTDSVVENSAIRCTHYDAFRFFTSDAVPLNRTQLVRESTADHDQPGCVHANMDLYKFAYKLAPWTSSEVMADAFRVAVLARELDMRASPYDLQSLGFEPIRIETRDGREEYLRQQRRVADRAMPVRERLLAEYRQVQELTGTAEPRKQRAELVP